MATQPSRGRPRGWAIVFGLGLALLAGCVPAKPPTTSLRISASGPVDEIGDAGVTIDDEYVGRLSYVMQRGVALPQGSHTITVEKPGYFPFDREIEATGSSVSLDIELRPIPD